MTLIQFLAIGLTILILLKTISDFKKNRINLLAFLFWTGLWSSVIIVAALPQITMPLAKISGLERGIDVVVYFAIVFIFFLLFKIIAKLEKIEYEITQIVRKNALQKQNNRPQKKI